ncbi:MAG: HAD family hydrolase [Erysipelothrix sp.]|nr:HAD family hydrolase [Erysipelothrix sp.]
MNESKAIFFDVDGTLLDTKTHITPSSTIETLKTLKRHGYKIAIATGRNFEACEKAGVTSIIDWDGYVTSNGQQLYDENQQCFYQYAMDPEVVRQIEQIVVEDGLNIQFKGFPDFMRFEADDNVKTAHEFFKLPYPTLAKSYQGEDVTMILVYAPRGYDYQKFMKLNGTLVMPGESNYADIVSVSHSKYTGIKQLLEKWEMPESYVAFGDSLNDMEMFKHAEISVAMGNGNAALKAKATLITDSVLEDGIYHACKKLNLI